MSDKQARVAQLMREEKYNSWEMRVLIESDALVGAEVKFFIRVGSRLHTGRVVGTCRGSIVIESKKVYTVPLKRIMTINGQPTRKSIPAYLAKGEKHE